MDPISMLLLTICVVVLFFWIVQGLRLYRNCKGDLYSDLYGGFLMYFYRYVILRDCSESGYLRSRIGTHRIVFSTIAKEENRKSRFCVIFYNKGIMVVCYDKATGTFLGRASNKDWNVIRTDKEGAQHTYRHHNPTNDMKAYLTRLAGVFPEVHMEARLAFHDRADVSKLHSEIKTIHFGELEEELKNVQADFVSDDEIKAMYKKIIEG